MTDTIVIARDMIRGLGERVDACHSKVPLMVYHTIERVEDAFNEGEINHSTLWDEKWKIKNLAEKFDKNCLCNKTINPKNKLD